MDACRRRRRPSASFLALVLIVSAFASISSSPSVGARGPAASGGDRLLAASTPVPPTMLFRQGQVLPMGNGSDPDSLQAGKASVLFDGGVYKMWYFGCTPSYYCTIDYATSQDGHAWTKHGVVLSPNGTLEQIVAYPDVLKVGGTFWMFYGGSDYSTYKIFAATSADGVNWTRQGLVLGPGPPGSLDAYEVVYPAVLHNGTAFSMWYTGLDSPTPPSSWLLLAVSSTGLDWTRKGLALPRGPPGSLDAYAANTAWIQRVGGLYEMMYNGQASSTESNILYAESSDGLTWQKLGLALAPLPGTENAVGAPSFLVEANQSWSVWYSVRNGSTDISIYLAVSDAEAPQTAANSTGTAGKAGWYVSPVTVTLSAHDNLSGAASTVYSIDGSPEASYTGPITLTDGVHTVTYHSEDDAGNVETNRSLSVNVDTMSPTSQARVEATLGQQGWYVTPASVNLTASDAGSGVANLSFSLDGGAWLDYATPIPLGDGSHVLLYRAEDVAGNVEPVNALVVRSDTKAPTSVAYVQGTAGARGWYVSTATVNLTAADGTSGLANVTYRVDGGVWQTYSASLVLQEGIHNLSYRAADVAGNVETPRTLVVKVDLTPPTVSLEVPAHWTMSDVPVTWSGADPVSGIDHYELSVDGGEYAPVSRPASQVLGLTDGTHTIRIRAVDGAGLTAVANATVTVDTNVFSVSGPYSGIPSFLLVAVAIGIVAFVLWRRRRKATQSLVPPEPAPAEPPKGP